MGQRYSLTRAERETTICSNAEDKIAYIYTSDPVYMRKFDRLCSEDPETYKCIEVDPLGYYKRYTAPMKRVSFRKSPSKAKREAGRKVAEARRNTTE